MRLENILGDEGAVLWSIRKSSKEMTTHMTKLLKQNDIREPKNIFAIINHVGTCAN